MTPADLGVYLVTDPGMGPGLEAAVRPALEAGVRLVQLRDKEASTRSLLRDAEALLELCREFDAKMLVNDRVDVALAVGAHGVHLGQDDMPTDTARRLLGENAVIGVSVRSPSEARLAQAQGADYLAANMVYATATKTDLSKPLGERGVARLRAASSLPLVAIGGIDASNAGRVVALGADGVAVVSAIMGASRPGRAAAELLSVVRGALRERDS